MKKIVFVTTALVFVLSANAQIGKLFKKDKGDSGSESKDLPKGIEIYSNEHSDAVGISGKYFTKYELCFEAKNMMNMPKTFKLSELTIEYRPDELNATIHYIKDEAKNQVRYKSSDETKEVDLEIMGGTKIGKANIEKNNYYAFKLYNKLMRGSSVQKQAFKYGVVFYRYSKDPEIILVADATTSKKDGKETLRFLSDNTCTFMGGCLNVISKNKEKLADWDSTKIANAIFDELLLMRKNVSSAAGDVFDMPPQVVKDDARDKEYFNLIQPFAAQDKPVTWGDRMDYVYIAKDWKLMYRKDSPKVISHRTALIVAVSHGWPNNECRFIYCSINQPWDGTKFGASFMAGFTGALIPISCQKVKDFKH